MKKILLKLIFIICLICSLGVTAYAYESLHICERFDTPDFEAYEYWYRKPLRYATPEHYVRVLNNELVLSVGAYQNVDSWPMLTLPNPVKSGKVTISFYMKIEEGGKLVSYHGMGTLYPSSGGDYKSRGICTGSQGIYCGNDNTNIISRDVLSPGDYHNVRIELDLDSKSYDIYIDNTMYCEDDTYLGEDLSEIGFNITSSESAGYKVYLDNVTVYDEKKYIFVSPDGDDENIGSYEEPVRTFERAAEMFSEHDNAKIYVLSGEYDLPPGFSYKNGDISTTMTNLVFHPYYNEVVYIKDEVAEVPELEKISAPDKYKEKFLEETNEYTKYFPFERFQYKNFYLDYDYEQNYIKYGFEATGGGNVPVNVNVIAAVYRFGKLIDCITDTAVICAGNSNKFDFRFNTDIEYNTVCKIFIWDGEGNLKPIDNDVFNEVAVGEKGSVNLSPQLIEIYEEDIVIGENTMTIPITSRSAANVTVKLLNENGDVTAFNQYSVGSGKTELTVKSKYSLIENTLYVQGVAK